MALGWLPIVHLVAALFAIIEIGLTAYIASADDWWAWPGSQSTANFMVFNSVWTLVVLIYVGLTPIYLTSIFHKLAALALNVITSIFWFAGSIALAVAVGDAWNCNGTSLCGATEAAVVFGFLLWVLFTVLCIVDGLEAFRGRGHATGV